MKLYRVPIYGYKLYIFVGDDYKSIVKSINRKLKECKLTSDDITEIKNAFGEPIPVGFFLGLSLTGNGILWISEKFNPGKFDHFVTMSHEVIHTAIKVFEFIGTDVNSETEEPFCYLHDNILEVCLKELEKSKNGHKNTIQDEKGLLQ